MLENARLLASLRTDVNAPAKAAAQRAQNAMERRRPKSGTFTIADANIGPKMPTTETMA